MQQNEKLIIVLAYRPLHKMSTRNLFNDMGINGGMKCSGEMML